MTSSLEYFNIFKDKLFWTKFAMKLTTFQTFNAEWFVDSHYNSLKTKFLTVYLERKCVGSCTPHVIERKHRVWSRPERLVIEIA